jgi:enoyl-CoA hydratase/carnithine racemase
LTDPLRDDLLPVRLNRPERLNALSQPLIEQLADALARLETDPRFAAWCSPGRQELLCGRGPARARTASAGLPIRQTLRELRHGEPRQRFMAERMPHVR